MLTAYLVVTGLAIAGNAFEAVASFTGATFMRDNATEVGVPHSWLRPLGVLKGLGALGLLIGAAGVLGVPKLFGFLDPRWIGVAAAAGLVLFFVGAVVTHVRAGVLYNIAFPGAFLALAVGSLVLVLLV